MSNVLLINALGGSIGRSILLTEFGRILILWTELGQFTKILWDYDLIESNYDSNYVVHIRLVVTMVRWCQIMSWNNATKKFGPDRVFFVWEGGTPQTKNYRVIFRPPVVW